MVRVYAIQSDGTTEPFAAVRCKNEDRELQRILERNPDLLPGEQIRPDDPRRWLVIQREMPVPDPNSGEDRWNVDFLFADQDAMPTFIECKRYGDTRARREVVGQVIEYAANGHYYWTKDVLREYAEKTAEQRGAELEDSLDTLEPNDAETVDAFFEQLQDNLREGQIRIVFFLEESPMELRSMVDFLNKQMERSEILIVEAKQFEREGRRCVVPVLFGFSEEARSVKRLVKTSHKPSSPARRKWDQESFFAESAEKNDSVTVEAMQKLFDYGESSSFKVSWGTGAQHGTFALKLRKFGNRSVLNVGTSGNLGIGFGWFSDDPKREAFRDRLRELVSENLGLGIPDGWEDKWPTYPASDWCPKVDAVIQTCEQLRSEFA